MKISFAKEIKVFDGKTSIENPFKLRDPFHSPIFKKSKNSDIAGKISSTVYNDAPSINNVKLDDITITGVVIGKERRAFAKAKGVNRVVILKEGMKIGENKAELRAILPGGLILVEKTVNIYGEEEYLETILPISK
ncbi:MAG: hypothetical protein N4A33_09780 [Bacteriovoracaceae bacterium]|jgi:type IV pilus assembly protein PilP|nr:hypothetical protein [Bacteriovoracaceae bacterium]